MEKVKELRDLENRAREDVAEVLANLDGSARTVVSQLRTAILNARVALDDIDEVLRDNRLAEDKRTQAEVLTSLMRDLDAAHEAAYPRSSGSSELAEEIEKLQEAIGDVELDATALETVVADFRNELDEYLKTGLEEFRDAFQSLALPSAV